MNTEFGKYELLEKIGTGGMAEVFLAKSFGAEGLEKILVIKRILPEFSDSRRFVDMFISEAKIAVDLNHPNIVQIYDFGKVEETYYLAMEYVDGPDLADLMNASRKHDQPISVGDAVFMGTQIAKGLDYAHRRRDRFGNELKIVHRDVSPQNILVSRDGTVKVVDFGIAKATSVADASPQAVKGKFSYMSPEQARGKSVDSRSDIFSFGVVFFELLCGRPLYKFTTKEETMSMVKSAVVPDIANLNPNVPEALQDLMYRMLAKDPADRPQSARDVQVELTKILYGIGEFRDSTTLAAHVSGLERHLNEESQSDATAIASDLATFRRTGTGFVTATGGTMAPMGTPPITIMVDSVTRVPQLQARERKECVIVSGRLQGLFGLRSELGQARWLQVLQEYTRIVDSISYKNDAVVQRVNEDGFVILLGIPVSSVNDAENAARVAMDLHEAVAGMNPSLEHPISLSVGMAIGNVLLEQEVDQTGRRFSWSFHDTAHELAERLARVGMAREVLLGGQVARRIRRSYECEAVDSLPIEESDEASGSVRAYLLTGPKSQADRIDEVRRAYHGFHGRELQLKDMRERFREALLAKRTTAMVITGPTGIGKSTLVEEFLSGLDARNVRFLRGVVPAYERDVPLACLATLMGEMMRLGDRDDLRAIRTLLKTRVKALFSKESSEEQALLMNSLGALFGIRFPESEFAYLSAEERRARIFLSVNKLLTQFAQKKPLVITVDDAHFLDSMTLRFVTEYVGENADVPAVLILSADSGVFLESNAWTELLDQKNVWREGLEELGDSEGLALLTELLRSHGIHDSALTDEILRRAGGNPFYIKEVVGVLRDRGLLTESADRGQVGEEDASWLPSNVEGLLRARIDRLALPLKAALQRCALLWSPFSGEDADLVLDPESSADELQELVVLGFFLRADMPQGAAHDTYDPFQTPAADRKYRFANSMAQEVAARGLVEDEASKLHGILAKHLVDSGGAPANALIARHFEGAGETERSVEFYFQAAGKALEHQGATEGLRLCDRVLERVEAASDMGFEALKIKSKALLEVGSREDAAAIFARLREVAKERGNPLELADVLLRLAKFEFQHSDMQAARSYGEQAEKIGSENKDSLIQARAWLIFAMVGLNEGARETAGELAGKAEAAAAEIKDDPTAAVTLCDALNLQGIALQQSGRHTDALVAYERGAALAERVEQTSQRRRLLTNAGIALAYLGQFQNAILRYEEALQQTRRLGYRRQEAGLLINLGHAHLLRGATDDALKSVRRGNYLARKTNSQMELADGLITLGAVHLERGENGRAESSLHEGLRLADSIPNVYLSVHATLLLAQVQLAAGTSDAARIALMQAEDAVERSEGAGMIWGVSYGNMLMARALKKLGKREDAIEHSKTAVKLVNEGEIYAIEEVLYYHFEILPDNDAFESDRKQAILRAHEVIIHRRDLLPDSEARGLFMNRPLNRQILRVSQLMKRD